MLIPIRAHLLLLAVLAYLGCKVSYFLYWEYLHHMICFNHTHFMPNCPNGWVHFYCLLPVWSLNLIDNRHACMLFGLSDKCNLFDLIRGPINENVEGLKRKNKKNTSMFVKIWLQFWQKCHFGFNILGLLSIWSFLFFACSQFGLYVLVIVKLVYVTFNF